MKKLIKSKDNQLIYRVIASYQLSLALPIQVYKHPMSRFGFQSYKCSTIVIYDYP